LHGLVTKNGVIPGSVVVYKVSAKATAEDYHKNVGEKEFTKWHERLQAILNEMGGNFIIIMVRVQKYKSRKHYSNECYLFQGQRKLS
jgi:tRNA(Leu) C34 or U34 (ribose-2'-O)-methylase TrmL